MLDITKLSFSYPKEPKLFSELELHEPNGSIIGLLGKNGAGKSTLLKLIAGLIRGQNGTINVMGDEPIKRTPHYLEKMFLVPEELDLPSCSMATYIKGTAPFYPSFSHEKMNKILAEFELNNKRVISRLSYGQKKKFLIAFALSTNCKLLLLDEPTNGLDIPSKAMFRKVVASSLSDDQMVVISTHQVKDVENLIDKIILLENGTVIFERSTLDIVDNYAFEIAQNPNGSGVIYSEPIPGGHKTIRNSGKHTTEIDIELLFNAVINGTKLN